MKIMDLFKKKEEPKTQPTAQPKPVPKIKVIMQDGKEEEYPEHFLITDKINCVVCDSHVYHFSLDCENLKWETKQHSLPIKASTIKDEKKSGRTVCMNCDRELYLFNHPEKRS